MKKIISLLLALSLATALFACAPAAAPAAPEKAQAAPEPASKAEGEEALSITFVTPLIGMPVWLDAKAGAEAAGKEFNAEVAWVGPQDIDINAQVEQTEQAIANKVDGIIGCPLNPTAFEAVYNKAMGADIPVVNTAVDSAEDTRLAFIGTDTVQMGVMAAEAINQKMNGEANVAVLCTALDTGNQLSSFNAFESTCKEKFPGIKVITREADDSDMLKAVDKTNSILATYPEVNVIYCLEANAGPGAAKVIEEKNLVGKVTIVAVDDTDETLDYIRKGTIWGTVTQNFFKMGYDSVKYIAEYKRNGTKPPSITDSGTLLVTLDNIDTYKK